MSYNPKKKPVGDRLRASDFNDLLDYIDRKTDIRVSGGMLKEKVEGGKTIFIPKQFSSSGSTSNLKMFIAEVVSSATGSGYYNCYLQKFDATDWNTDNDPFSIANEPETWNIATTYIKNDLVKSTTYWKSLKSDNLGNTPAEGTYWTAYDLKIVVLNLAEFGVADTHSLSEGDIIFCWKILDDEGNSRYLGNEAFGKSFFDECT